MKDIQKEEEEKQRKKQVFIEDLDQQTEEKKETVRKIATADKAERFRETNALASKLSKLHMNLDEPVISVSTYILNYFDPTATIRFISILTKNNFFRISDEEEQNGTDTDVKSQKTSLSAIFGAS